MRRGFILIAAVALIACAPEPVPEFHATAGRDICQGGDGFAAAFDGRRTFLWRADWLKRRKAELGDFDSGLAKLTAEADLALAQAPYSVVDKTTLPPSGDKQDYLSQATYWWPDPNKPDGLPYIRKDGETNPDVYSAKFDLDRLSKMSADVTALGLAYYFTDDERYARHAVAVLQASFLIPRPA